MHTDKNELETIRLILRDFAKGHDIDTIANALELPAEYVETIIDAAGDDPYLPPEIIVDRLSHEENV